VVPAHSSQMNTLWQGVGEVGSALMRWDIEGGYNQGHYACLPREDEPECEMSSQVSVNHNEIDP